MNAIFESCCMQCIVMTNQVFHNTEFIEKFDNRTASHLVPEFVFFEAANAEFHFDTHASSG